jgi:hypothetical protein
MQSVLVGTPDEIRLLETPSRRWKDKIRVHFKKQKEIWNGIIRVSIADYWRALVRHKTRGVP